MDENQSDVFARGSSIVLTVAVSATNVVGSGIAIIGKSNNSYLDYLLFVEEVSTPFYTVPKQIEKNEKNQ